jgi:hypothetical protein
VVFLRPCLTSFNGREGDGYKTRKGKKSADCVRFLASRPPRKQRLETLLRGLSKLTQERKMPKHDQGTSVPTTTTTTTTTTATTSSPSGERLYYLGGDVGLGRRAELCTVCVQFSEAHFAKGTYVRFTIAQAIENFDRFDPKSQEWLKHHLAAQEEYPGTEEE